MKTKIIFSAGAKGGTGKSTAIRHLVSWYHEAGIQPLLVDADDENSTLTRFFPEAIQISPRRPKSYDVIVSIAESGRHPLMIVDLKAGVGNDMLNWFADVPFAVLKEIGVSMVCVGVITSSPDSTSSLLHWVHFLGKRVKYVVFKNTKDSDCFQMRAEEVPFPEYDRTKEALEFRKLYKPLEIALELLDPEMQSELERANLTIREVLSRSPRVPLELSSLMVRARLRNYQERLYDKFTANKDVFLP